jgi:hypothetical protein
MKQLREITRRQRKLPLGEFKDTINADCRLLQIHAIMSDDEKRHGIDQFARRVVSIEDYDVFLFAVW